MYVSHISQEENVRNVMDKRRRQRVLHERLEIWKGVSWMEGKGEML